MKPIGYIKTDFHSKFGIPRQSGIINELKATVIFYPEYSMPDAFRGLSAFSHIWLIWQFSDVPQNKWSPLVRPPRLGGNTYVGVFATRSPYRPNRIGLSSVKLDSIEYDTSHGTVLHISGADLKDGTPIYDVKPYLPYTDSHPDASMGFAPNVSEHLLNVNFPDGILSNIPERKQNALLSVLKLDPRPSYHDDPDRVYGLSFGGFNIKFKVDGKELTVIEAEITE